jgi:acyl-CoA thioester hydrolase
MPLGPSVFEYRHVVRDDEIDELQHASNLVYLKWTQAAAMAHSDAAGWTAQRYFERQTGWVVRSHEIEYLQPAFAGEEIVVKTWIADMKRISSLRRYVISRPADGARLAIAATNWAFVDYRTGRLTRIPEALATAFEILADEPLA